MARRRRKRLTKQQKRIWMLGGVALSIVLAGLGLLWLHREHPEHLPWTALDLEQPVGMATRGKLVGLRDDRRQCMNLLRKADIKFTQVPANGLGECRADDQVRLGFGPPLGVAFAPQIVEPSCPVAAAYVVWQREVVQPAAQRIYGQRVTLVEHMGSHVCRRIARSTSWSQHSTANAIDISAFVLADGRRISLIAGWHSDRDKDREFLREVRDGACGLYTTVLSPDYNRDHRDHLHFDMAQRNWGSSCR